MHSSQEQQKVIAVLGSIPELGGGISPVKMNFVLRTDPISGEKTYCWEKEFLLEEPVPDFKYRYLLLDLNRRSTKFERSAGRHFSGHVYEQVQRSPGHSPSRRKDFVSVKLNKSCYKVYDYNFVTEFKFHMINENIFIGPYPQNIEEVEELQKHDIKAVLNLQTKKDMKKRLVSWEEMSRAYEKRGITGINFPITDMDPEDMSSKAHQVAEVLKHLVDAKEKVYVHCTAGVGRAPQTVIAYLCFFKQYKLDEAIRLVQEKRPTSRPHRGCLKIALATKKKSMNLRV
eukprot:TRINITY_DN9993_c0_g1_i3.p2 TRINITY_DN9993_c0_g1~~TRINITY_DN9993_c0_g1_i3.p2  ORF type:complete len:286 (-),score=80.67 TRINITY_DN9993_c0_g1_i3:869-1726(-)